jgi:vacuolar-type H+-ATPase subunit I/STV1
MDENTIKNLMEMVEKQNKVIEELKNSIKTNNNQPINLGMKFKQPEAVNNIAGDEIEKIKQDELAKNELKKQIEAEIKLKAEADEFNNKYGNLISDKATFEAIDKANMSQEHKLKLKMQSLFKNDENINILSPFIKEKVSKLLSVNETEIANIDITEDYFEIMSNFNHSNDLKAKTQAKFGNVGMVVPKKESIAEAKWKEAIAEANGK